MATSPVNLKDKKSIQTVIQAMANPLNIPQLGLEVVDLPIYDSFTIAQNTAFTNQILFQTPIGGSKTLAETNLVQAGQLEGGTAFTIDGLCVKVQPDVAFADLVLLTRNVTFDLRIGSGRTYYQAPLIMIPGGTVPTTNGSATTVAATTISSASNGAPTVQILPLKYPVTIGDGEHFEVDINAQHAFSTSAGGTGLVVWVAFYGSYFRYVR